MIDDAVLYAARFVHFGAAMILFGGALFPFYTGMRSAATSSLRASWLALASALLWFGCVIVNVGGGLQTLIDPNALRAILFETGFGRAWLLHLALGAAVVIASVRSEGRSASFCAIAGLYLASLAGIGHATMNAGAIGIAHQASHAVHLLAGGAWLGGLFPLRRAIRALGADDASQIASRFSRMGYVAVAAVVVTGLANMRLVTGSFLPNIGTTYGVLLAIKIAFAAMLIAVAGFNRIVSDRLEQRALLTRSIVSEQVIFACILVAVSVFGVLPPA